MSIREEYTDESEEKPLTFPQCNSFFSRIRQSARAPSQRKPWKPLRRIPLAENFTIEQESRSDKQQNTNISDIDSQSYDSLFGEVIPHKTESSWNTTRENENDDDKFYCPENNRKNLNMATPLPLKLCTPFSKINLSLVKRVVKSGSTDYNGGIGAHCVKDSRQVLFPSDQFSLENHGRSNGKLDGLISSDNMNDKRNERVLKDMNYDRNNIDQCNKQVKKYPETVKEIRDTNNGTSNPKENVFDQPLAYNMEFKYSTGALQYNKENPSLPEKLKSQQTSFKERENLKTVLEHDTRLSSEMNSVLYVNNIQYTVLNLLGRGGSSEVYQVLNKKSTLLAIKCVNLGDADIATAEGYLKEIKMLTKLRDSNRIIKLIDHEYLKHKQMLYIVMEKGDTDFSTLLRQMVKSGDSSIPMVIYYWTEMLHAVQEIHKNGIVHADLKPANFLLVCGRLKLIDFGIASAIQNDATSVFKSSMHGTCNYMSPEAIDAGDSAGAKVGYKSDVWSLGCILYNMLYRRTPFQHISRNLIKLQTIANPNHKIEFPPISGCPPILMETLKHCLIYDYKKRPTVAELLAINYICKCNEDDF